MLLRLNEFRRDQQKLYSILLLSQADASEQALFAIQSGSANRFVDALAAQRLALEALGRDAGLNIVTSELSALADVAANESAAVLPAGAGGGDVAVFVGLRPPSERLRRLFVNFQLEPLKLSIGARGVHRIFTREFSTIPITNPPKRD
jgi:phosphomevalonate kinase